MESEGSLPCPQEPASLIPILCKMNPVYIAPSYIFKIHFNVITDGEPLTFIREVAGSNLGRDND
jgi:hypothetical protein